MDTCWDYTSKPDGGGGFTLVVQYFALSSEVGAASADSLCNTSHSVAGASPLQA